MHQIAQLIAGLRNERVEAGLTCAEIDHAARLRPGTCEAIEHLIEGQGGKKAIPWAELFKICKVLGLNIGLVLSQNVDNSKKPI